MFEIPKSVKIGGQEYKIVFGKANDFLIHQPTKCYGQCDYFNCKIELSEEICQQLKETTLIHEAIHAMSEVYHMELDEHMVRILETGIYAFIKDNIKNIEWKD